MSHRAQRIQITHRTYRADIYLMNYIQQNEHIQHKETIEHTKHNKPREHIELIEQSKTK